MQNSNCPFEIGLRYQIIKEYKFQNHVLKAGEIVEFIGDIYDRMIGHRYVFKDCKTGEENSWFMETEREASDSWKFFFERTDYSGKSH